MTKRIRRLPAWHPGRFAASLALGVAGFLAVVAPGCDGEDEVHTREGRSPDGTVVTHAVAPSTPSASGLAYLEAVAKIQQRADKSATDRNRQLATLHEGLALPVPAGLGEAEIVRLEMATRLGELYMQTPEGVPVARDLLQAMLPTKRSLPLDRASAKALIVLGDAALETGDDALAAGSYARAIKVMGLLREELEP